MKAYRIFRWFLRASALTTVMFVMQACYGSPNMPPEVPDETELIDEEQVEMSVSDTLTNQNSL